MRQIFSILLLCAVSATFPVQAQTVINLDNPKAISKGRKCNVLQVVDSRLERDYLGTARSGLNNRIKRVIIANGNLGNTVDTWFKTALPRQAELPEVVIKINRLGVWEEMHYAAEVAKISADFEFYRKIGQQWYFLRDMRYWHNEPSGINATKLHEGNLEGALKAVCQFLNDSIDWAVTPVQQVSEADIMKRALPAVLSDSVLVPGAYKNFREFRANKPTVASRIEDKNGEKSLSIQNSKGKYKRVKPTDKLWGFSDGKDIYIHQQGVFFKLEPREGSTLKFYGYDVVRRNTRINNSAAAFGLIGALITANNASSEPDNLFLIDWESGSFYHAH
jgi:hypothetical protein